MWRKIYLNLAIVFCLCLAYLTVAYGGEHLTIYLGVGGHLIFRLYLIERFSKM